ncbi:unnamed protein product [Eruca vesicaria subsp. sativa]|uniref:Uncharacterized protein n=1 Tax=Eruca vesicaria subsp. sativa TaxID=29727 RepID=A0ABC8M631_ERUVS|nr:unnamed protein product [Eruca vesicaria subsp. sativa]
MFHKGRGILRAAGRGLLRAAGGGLLRAAGRVMKRTGGVAKGGIQEPFGSSPSTPGGNALISLGGGFVNKFGSNNLRISAASGSLLNLPVATTSRWNGGAFSFNSYNAYEDFEWVTVEEDDSVFGSVPSVDEVEDAVSALKQVFDGGGNQSPMPTGMAHQVPSFGTELDWVEPSMELCHSRILQPHAYDHVYNAFDLLRTEPSVQKMVLALSSDKAVWKAVRNNEVVQEIKELYYNGINQDEESSDEESSDDTARENNTPIDFIKWLFDSTGVKATGVLKKITKLVIEILNSCNVKKKRKRGKLNNWFEEMLKTSVFLSIMVMLIVMVSRDCNMYMNVPS